MSAIEITSLPTGTAPVHQQVTRLGGVDYVLTFRYSARTAGWHLDIDEYPNTRLVTGVRVRPGFNLFADAVGRGTLHVIHTDGSVECPTRLDFAQGLFRLWYDSEWEGQP